MSLYCDNRDLRYDSDGYLRYDMSVIKNKFPCTNCTGSGTEPSHLGGPHQYGADGVMPCGVCGGLGYNKTRYIQWLNERTNIDHAYLQKKKAKLQAEKLQADIDEKNTVVNNNNFVPIRSTTSSYHIPEHRPFKELFNTENVSNHIPHKGLNNKDSNTFTESSQLIVKPSKSPNYCLYVLYIILWFSTLAAKFYYIFGIINNNKHNNNIITYILIGVLVSDLLVLVVSMLLHNWYSGLYLLYYVVKNKSKFISVNTLFNVNNVRKYPYYYINFIKMLYDLGSIAYIYMETKSYSTDYMIYYGGVGLSIVVNIIHYNIVKNMIKKYNHDSDDHYQDMTKTYFNNNGYRRNKYTLLDDFGNEYGDTDY